jgi:phage FluMu protein Com
MIAMISTWRLLGDWIEIVSTWRCVCGNRVRVLAEADPARAIGTVNVSCPACKEIQKIQARRVLTVTTDKPPGHAFNRDKYRRKLA